MKGSLMETFLDWFNHWPWLNPVLLILAILAVGTGYYFYRKSLREKRLTYGALTHRIVAGVTSPKLSITYDGVPVKSLSESTMYIWNKGRLHIDGADNQTIDKLRIVPSSDQVILYDSTILRQSDKVNNFRIDHDHAGNQIALEFDYMNYRHGVAISVLHSGLRSQDIKLVGTIKGAKESVKRYTMFRNDEVVFLPAGIARRMKASTRYRLNSLMFVVFLLFFVLFTAASFFKELSAGSLPAIFVLVGIVVAFGWIPIMHARRIPPSSIVDLE
jgi:hypothetical protein